MTALISPTENTEELEKLLNDFVAKLPIKATEIGWEKIGEDSQELATTLRNREHQAVQAFGEKVLKEVIGEYELSMVAAPPILNVDPSSGRSGDDIVYLMDVNRGLDARRKEYDSIIIRDTIRAKQRSVLTSLMEKTK